MFSAATIDRDWRRFERSPGAPAVSLAIDTWVTTRFEELLGAVARSGTQSG
jgi:hypothetical protein